MNTNTAVNTPVAPESTTNVVDIKNAKPLPVQMAPIASDTAPKGKSKAKAKAKPPATKTVVETPPSEEKSVKKPPVKPSYKQTTVIKVLTANPHRVGTKDHDRFKLYTDGMTVEQAIEKGARKGDIAWYAQRKHIKVGK